MVDVIGMFFFDDNILCLQEGNEFGERLAKIAKENNMLLMACDQCAVRRGFAEGTFEQCGGGDVKPKGMVGTMVGMVKPLSGLKRKKTPKTKVFEDCISH